MQAMNTEYKNQKSKETIIKEIKERLRWYAFEASEEEVDSEEMMAMMRLLEILEEKDTESEVDVKEAYGRFLAHRAQWEADEPRISALRSQEVLEASEKLGDCEESPANRAGKAGYRSFGWKFGRLGAKGMLGLSVAALFAAVLTAWGALGVNAERNNGFFHWLDRDETGVTMITSPDSLETGTNIKGTETYESWDEVPESYKQYEIQSEDLEILQGYILKRVETTKTNSYVNISSQFEDEENGEILNFSVMDYENEISYSRLPYFDAEYLYSIEIGGIQMDVLFQEDQGDKIYTAYFYFDKGQYCVRGKGELELIEEAAREYYAFVSGK